MAKEFNPENIVIDFIDKRKRYLKKHLNENRFYSQKYQFVFSVEFTKENNNHLNCGYYKIYNLQESFLILEEFNVILSSSNKCNM